jgi:hypothetical protein
METAHPIAQPIVRRPFRQALNKAAAPGGIKGVFMQIRNLLAATLLFSMSIAALPAVAATHVEAKKPTTTKLKISSKSFIQGQSGKLTVKVEPKTASGIATVYYKELPDGTYTAYGTISIFNGVGTGDREAGDVGKFELKVVFEGSKKLESSTSNKVTVTVAK